MPNLSTAPKEIKSPLDDKTPTVGFVSLGCPKALVDCEQIITKLKILGYQTSNNYQNADLVLVNTCGFIESAVDESFSAIAEALQANGRVVVSGCLGKFPQKLMAKFPQIIKIVGANVDEVVAAVESVLPINNTSHPKNNVNFNFNVNAYKKANMPTHGIKLTPNHYAYLKIAEGCNHKCKFCIIPQMRGKLISRPPADIIREAKSLADNGVSELLIIAQDLLAYGSDFGNDYKKSANKDKAIINLIDELAKTKTWLRLLYIYPYPFVEEIIARMASGAVLPYLDIPLQHVSAKVLRSMQRPASPATIGLEQNHAERLISRLNKWRQSVNNLVIRSTFIVGYPGESESDFEELLSFVGQAQLDRVGCFTYSPVEGARANKLPDQVPENIKLERQKRLMKLQEKISKVKLKKRVGKIDEVIIQDVVNIDGENYYLSRSFAEAPEIDGVILIPKTVNYSKLGAGQKLKVKITQSSTHDLLAEVVEILPNNFSKRLTNPRKTKSNQKLKSIPVVVGS